MCLLCHTHPVAKATTETTPTKQGDVGTRKRKNKSKKVRQYRKLPNAHVLVLDTGISY